MRGKSVFPFGIPTPNRPARTVVTIPTTLFPLTVVVMVVVLGRIYVFFFLFMAFILILSRLFKGSA